MSDGYFYDRREWRLAREDHNFLPVWSWWAGDDRYTVRWGRWNVAVIEYDDGL